MTSREVEANLGAQVRVLRKQAGLTQGQVARDAGISVSALHALEHGQGSTLGTLVSVLRALEAEDWLATLSPVDAFSPRAAHRAAGRTR